MGNFRKKNIVFKIKDTTKQRDSGFKPDQKGKQNILQMLNDILRQTNSDYVYDKETTKQISNSKELIIDLEILYRYYDYKKIQDKKWFLTYEEFLINKYFRNN